MKLEWRDNFARAHGWTYMIQTERPLHEGTIYSLLLKPPGEQRFYDQTNLPVGPKVPFIESVGRQETLRYVKREAQAHANQVAIEFKLVDILPMPRRR
jgi:hypothetical protein